MLFVHWLTNLCLSKEIIVPEEAEWFAYGITRRLSTIFTVLVLFPIACHLSSWDISLSFFLSFFYLRKRTNGYHANSFTGCLFFSMCSVYVIFHLVLPRIPREAILCIPLMSSIIILLLAPIQNENIKMSEAEQKKTAFFVKRNTVLLLFFILCSKTINYFNITVGLSLGVGYTAFLLILAYYTLQRRKMKNEKKNHEQFGKNTCKKYDPPRY